MQFLNPAFLWFALAVAVPIIVHLFNFRKPKRVLFSNLSFVKEVNQAVQKRLKLKQWLLLAARILAMLALAFAFANPILKDPKQGAARTQTSKSVVIVVDNSNSMSAADVKGVYLQQAKLLAREIVQAYSPSDEFQIITTGAPRFGGSFLNVGQAKNRVEEIDFKDKVVGYGWLLNNVSLFFSEATHPGKTLYFLSDYQTATVMKDSLASLAQLPQGMEINFVPIGGQKQVNVYVSNVGFENTIIEKNKPLTMNLTVNNDSEKEIKNLSIKVNVEEKAVAIASADLAAGESKTTQVTFTPTTGGWQNGSVSIDDTPIDFDNNRYFSYFIPENNKILLVTGDLNAQYLKVLYNNLVAQYQIVTIDQKALAGVALSDYTGVILAGVNDVSSGLSEKLKSWIQDGGGLIFFAHDKMDVPSVNRFYNELGIGQFGTLQKYKSPVGWATPDLSHPLFEGVFAKQKKNSEFDAPMVTSLYDFLPQNEGVQTAIIRDANGKIVLHEKKVGAGGVFTFSLYPSLEWSDFPLKTSFVPILYRATLILTHSAKNEFSQTIGKYAIKKIKTSSKELIKLRSPQGYEIIPEQYAQSGNIILKFDRADVKAGNYVVQQHDTVLEKASFNYDDLESHLAVTESGALEETLKEKGLTGIKVMKSSPDVLRNAVQQSRLGVPLWKYFLIFAFCMLTAEIAIIRLLK